MLFSYLVNETEGQPPRTQKDLKQEGTRANEKFVNSMEVAKRLSPTFKALSYFADWGGFSSHSINGTQNQFESNLN